jgi:D-3-phosphoglycerate dehydrogenase
MPDSQVHGTGDLPIVVGLGVVDPSLVAPVLGGHCRFIAEPTADDLARAQGAIARADAVLDKSFIAQAGRLKVIARTGVGVEKVDLETATARGIAVVITPGSGTNAVAEGAIAMAMHLVKRFGRLTTLVREGQWATRGTVSVGDLDGATLGVVGFGRIGQRTAALGAALGMNILAYDPVSQPPADNQVADLADLFRRSDIITLHLPLLDSTHHLVNAELLASVKPGAILINCGRGGLIDIDAVYTALHDGRLSGVGLDVFEPEPPQHHPLFDHPDVVLTPHLMGLSRQGTAATFTDAAQGVLDVLSGRRPAAVANPGWEQAAEPGPAVLEST